MDPRGFMWVQVTILTLAQALVALAAPIAAWGLAAALLLCWLGLDASYAHALSGRPRVANRARGDRAVTTQVALASSLTVVVAIAAAAVDFRIWASTGATVGATAIAVFWWATYASSLIDWYGIRPRRDGVVVAPPCRTSGATRWTTVTRTWWAHRSAVVVVCLLVTIVAWTEFGLLAIGDTPSSQNVTVGALVISGIGAGVGLIRLFFGNLGTIGMAMTSCVLSEPDIAIGDELVGTDEFKGGFVRDVALEGITVVPLDAAGRPLMTQDHKARIKVHRLPVVLDNPQVTAESCVGCSRSPGCLRLNEDCHWVIPDDEHQHLVATPGRRLVF